MQNTYFDETTNPISELISDEVYFILSKNKFINVKTVRNFIIRKRYFSLRANNISPSEAIEIVCNEYPYLQYDTIRKIVYNGK